MSAGPTPKDRFTSLDTLALARELRAVAGARVDKVFDLPGGGWVFALRSAGEGRRELRLVPGRYAALLAAGSSVHGDEPGPFARELRRRLVGAGLRDAQAPGGERYLELSFGRANAAEPLLVALEIFGSGNLIVADGGKIVAVAQARRWAHRVVRIGVEYARPPIRLDPWSAGRAVFESELARSRSDLASTLAARLSLGGPVAEELIARAGLIGSEPGAAGSAAVAERLVAAVSELLEQIGDRPRGFVYRRDEQVVDATPYPSRRWSDEAGVREELRPTFSDAAAEYFRSFVAEPTSAEEAAATSARRALERLKDQQTTAVAALAESVRELQANAEAIFAHYGEVEAALRDAPAAPRADGTVVVSLGGREVKLRTDRPPRESAQALYEEAKRFQSKLAGAQSALQETERKLTGAGTLPARPARASAPEPPRRKPHWFERFRWFISSEGAVVIAGRDASSNDLVVRRNLKDGDVYVHADLHGAASVVVKHPPAGAPPTTETTLREAGQWAVAYSKAWRAGLASASAFWVTPEQVTKSAASGEFVARGAWAIHGTKHRLDDLPTELALGTVRYAGDALWTAAPPSAVAARGEVRVVLVPGPERDRDALEVELASELGLNRTRLQSLLPAGGISRRRA
jgi:predicted ribosome quality control (RQC) complex YloA/Tae2 family protein